MKYLAIILLVILLVGSAHAGSYYGPIGTGSVGPAGPICGSPGNIIFNNAAVCGGFGSWDGTTLTVPGTNNNVAIAGSTTGNPVTMVAVGTDTDLPLLLHGKGSRGVWMSGGDSTALLIDPDGHMADIAFNEPVPLAPALIVANTRSDGQLGLLAYGVANTVGVVERIVTMNGLPAAPADSLDQDMMFTSTQYARIGGAAPVATYSSQIKLGTGGATAGAHQTWTGYKVTGVPIPFLIFRADDGSLTGVTSVDVAADAVNLQGATLANGTLTVATRTGTPAAAAAFDSGGKLVANGGLTTTITVCTGVACATSCQLTFTAGNLTSTAGTCPP